MEESNRATDGVALAPEADASFRSLFVASPDALLLVVADGGLLAANEAACRLFGWSEEELRRHGWGRVVDASDPRLPAALAEVSRSGRFNGTLTLLRRDGTRFPAEVFAAMFRNPEGREQITLLIHDDADPARLARPWRKSEQFAHRVIEALAAHICVLNATGTILAVNRAWREFAAANQARPRKVAEGINYLAVCDATVGPDANTAAAFAAGIRAVLRGEQTEFALEYPCHSPAERRWFAGRVTRFVDDRELRIVVAHENITNRKLAEEELSSSRELLRALAGRLQAVREEERTHIAREIHDVLAQELTRLKIDLVWLQHRLAAPAKGRPPVRLATRVAEMGQMADTAIRCVQRIATGLRPAVLDSLGLCAAVEWQARDFEAHSGIPCRVEVPAEELPVGRDAATAAFRVLQESLTNVVRHAGATQVEVSLHREAGEFVLRVADNGGGIREESLRSPLSIGLTGMRERALLLHGRLEIRTGPGRGTTIELRLPVPGNRAPPPAV